MDRVQDGAMEELLEIIRRADDEDEGEDAGKRVESLPRTSAEFQTCGLFSALTAQLEARLGAAADEAVASGELELDVGGGGGGGGGARPEAIDRTVARLAASPSFGAVVDTARSAVEQAAGAQTAAAAAAAAADAEGSGTATLGAAGSLLRRNVDALSSSDTEREGMHAKKKPARRDDWVGLFDLSGGGLDSGGGGFFSPRVDVEAALGQLEAGLESPGGSAASAVEALGLLAEADPELFQFGNHWPLFLELARRSLSSTEPAIHAKAMTLHWVMYEKSMGMCAADMCEGVLAHARVLFSSTVHVLSAPPTRPPAAAGSGRGCESSDPAAGNLMVVGDSRLACATREARALHGMLVTIHETFQHLPESRVWSIVNSFFFLFGDAAIASLAAEETHSDSTASERQGGGGGEDFAGEHVESSADVINGGDQAAVSPATQPSTPSTGEDPSSALLPAHLLAVAGQVDEWLPGWLRSLPTGRLVRAVNDAGLLEAMARRCKLRGRVPFRGFPGVSRPDPAVAAASNGAGGAAFSRAPASAQPGACPPKAAIVRHRLSVSAGSSGAFCSAGSAAPLGRALWLSAAELERALLLQSVSFLGVLATHCRGTLRPCPPPRDNSKERNEDGLSGGEVEVEGEAGEDEADRGLEQGKEALHALVQCVRRRDSCRAERGTKAQLLPRQPQPAAAKEDVESRSVRCAALGYVGQLAKAAAGGRLTPFTPPIIDSLFSPLGGTRSDGAGQGDGMSERGSGDHGAAGGGGADELSVDDESPAFLGALAEIAGVLLSSRGASAGFFVDGPEGPRASRALLELLRCTAELARRACRCRVGPDGGRDGGGGSSPEEGHADAPPACRFSSLGREDSKRLAVEFACALSPIMGNPPKLRAAGRAALWRCGVPHALARLVAYLGDPPRPEQSALVKENLNSIGDRNGHASGRSGTDGGGVGGHDSAHEDGDLRDRLLRSLVEWARDLIGVDSLRQVGLAGPCGSFLSRELGARHLDRSTRDECADSRLLDAAMRLALCPEGLGELLSADSGVVDGVQGGLNRLGELMTLPELLQSHAVGLPPPHALAPRKRLGGHDDGGASGCAGGDVPWRSPGLQLGGVAGDLRCLDFVCRLSASGALCSGSDPADPAAVQMRRWLRWGLSRVAPFKKAFLGAGDAAVAEEDADVAQDVRVVALELVANLAADLTTAVEMEAEWSLSETLARQKAEEEPAGARAASGAGAGGSGRTPSKAVAGPGPVCGGGGGERSVGSITCVPDVVEPAALGRARLAVSLRCLGGPNEERHKLLRKLRAAEALAGSDFAGSGCGGPPAAPVRTAGGIQRRSVLVQFPEDKASDEDWWDAAGRCAPQVAALLADPRGARRTEAFSLLRTAAARRSLLCPEEARPAELAAMDYSASPGAHGERGGSVLDGDLSERRHGVMTKLCFSYARSLGFVDDGHREHFWAGLRAALAAPTGSNPPSPDCDWFAAVAFIASGGDGAAASAMLQDLRRHTARAAFVLSSAGKRRAAPAVLETAAGVTGPEYPSLPVTSERERSSPGVAAAAAAAAASIAAGFGASPSPSAGEGYTAATAGSSPPPPPLMLLLGLVEEVLEEELPLLSAALRGSGWAAASFAGRWMRQSMLCVVDWPGVVSYLALALLRGHDYQVYFVVALFRAAQPRVMEAASRGVDLMPLLGGGQALEGFDLDESVRFMEALERRHRSRCLAATRAYLAR